MNRGGIAIEQTMVFNGAVAAPTALSQYPRALMRTASSELGQIQDDESLLVEQTQHGNRQAFGLLVERYWDRLYRWLYHLCHHRQTAEDLTQEAFTKALAGMSTFRPGSNFRAWLFRIAFNNFLNQRRGDARVRLPFPETLPDRQQGPAEEAVTGETLMRLARAMGRLPDEFRAALLLRAEEDLSFREIGAILEITEETARWRVFKARQKLMSVLAPQIERDRS
jgi:RNA polymerase sigma-70 factor (ECF subfamily)